MVAGWLQSVTFCERKRQPRRENSQTDPHTIIQQPPLLHVCVCSPRCAVCGPLASPTYSVNAFAFFVFSSSSFPAAKGQIDGGRCGGRNAEEGGGEM